MQKYLCPAPHLSFEEITKRYRECSDGHIKTWWHIIWLMSKPGERVTVNDASKMVGCHPNSARMVVHRYNAEGPDGVRDRRGDNPGQEPLLNEELRAELSKELLKRAPDGGLWTGSKVEQWVKDKTGRKPGKTVGWKYLRRLGFTLQQPRPSNTQAASKEEQATFKKSSRAVSLPSNVGIRTR
jgi:transposase